MSKQTSPQNCMFEVWQAGKWFAQIPNTYRDFGLNRSLDYAYHLLRKRPERGAVTIYGPGDQRGGKQWQMAWLVTIEAGKLRVAAA